jgi:hypothetical protein
MEVQKIRNIQISTQGGRVWVEEIEAAWGEEAYLEGYTPAEARELATSLNNAANIATDERGADTS